MIPHGTYRHGDAWRLALSDLRSLAYAAVVEAGATGDEVIEAVSEVIRVARARGLEVVVGRHRWKPSPVPRQPPP